MLTRHDDKPLLVVNENAPIINTELQPLLAAVSNANTPPRFHGIKNNLRAIFRAPTDAIIVLGIHGFAIVLTKLNPATAEFEDDLIQKMQLPFSASVSLVSLLLLHKDKLPHPKLKAIGGLFYELFRTSAVTSFGILTLAQTEGTVFGIIANYRPDFVTNAAYYPPFAVQCLISLLITNTHQLIKYSRELPDHLQDAHDMLAKYCPNFVNGLSRFSQNVADRSWLEMLVNIFLSTTTLSSIPITFSLPFDEAHTLKNQIIITGFGLAGGATVATVSSLIYQKKPATRPYIDDIISLLNLVNFSTLATLFYQQINKDKELNTTLLALNIALVITLFAVSLGMRAFDLCRRKDNLQMQQAVIEAGSDSDDSSDKAPLFIEDIERAPVQQNAVVTSEENSDKKDAEQQSDMQQNAVATSEGKSDIKDAEQQSEFKKSSSSHDDEQVDENPSLINNINIDQEKESSSDSTGSQALLLSNIGFHSQTSRDETSTTQDRRNSFGDSQLGLQHPKLTRRNSNPY